ncbi:MAG: hypothetical protein JWN79_350, partial [Gemmatimonadetes bacterium]|nr:hypothetical protein [Gemmatimonadota bacterium]
MRTKLLSLALASSVALAAPALGAQSPRLA